MLAQQHQELSDKIWAVANKLRGPYTPPQYRRVMLPMTVLRRLDCVLEPTKTEFLKQFEALKKRKKEKGMLDAAFEAALAKAASRDRKQPLYNVSRYTFTRLLGDPNGLAKNLTAYIKGFSPKVREIFEKFEFEKEIEKLDEANRLFEVVKEFASGDIDLHPKRVDNLAMGYVFENLIRRFNEQSNEEAGDHFTPREVIRLMAHLIYTGDEDIYRPGIARTVYDPACGTGGMLSVSEEYIRAHNADAHLTLFGQDYNPGAYAICCADMLIKDEPVNNIVFTLLRTSATWTFSGAA
jgi:type I restriction enzyme M protein